MYQYLGPRGTTSTRPNEGRDNDGLQVDQLKIALKTIGFSKQHVAQTCQLFAAIPRLMTSSARGPSGLSSLLGLTACMADRLMTSSAPAKWLEFVTINQRLCKENFTIFIGFFNIPGPQNISSRPNSLDQFCINFTNECLQNWLQLLSPAERVLALLASSNRPLREVGSQFAHLVHLWMCRLRHRCVGSSHLPHGTCVQHLRAGIAFFYVESKHRVYFNTG
jgi:hypothetical protein